MKFADVSPDISVIRSRVEEIAVEVKDHADKLDKLGELATEQAKLAETTDKLQTDVAKILSDIGDLAELRSRQDQTTTDVKEQHGKLEEVFTQQSRTAESVEQLQNDVTKIQSEVFSSVSFVLGD